MDRTDADLETEVLVITSQLNRGVEQTEELRAALDRVSIAHGIAQSFIRIVNPDQTEHVSSDLGFWPGVRNHPIPWPRLRETPMIWETASLDQGQSRIIYYRFPDGRVLQVGHLLTQMNTALARSRSFNGWAMVAMILLGGGSSGLITYAALKGIRRVSRAAITIREQGNLDYRVPEETGSGETDQLASTFNGMLERIQSLVANLRYVMDNIAHDIKTPVTRMRGVAEATLVKEDCPDPELCGHVLEECDLILNLVNTLLQITAAESGLYQWELRVLDLTELVREGCELFQPIFEDKNLAVNLELPERLEIATDGRVIQRVVANLVDNAVKYSEPGGSVGIRLERLEDKALLRISDTGIGIPEDELPLIFDRFYRTDHSRSRPGNGLGLSFCKATIEGLGGSIEVNGRPGAGAVFTVCLPVAVNG